MTWGVEGQVIERFTAGQGMTKLLVGVKPIDPLTFSAMVLVFAAIDRGCFLAARAESGRTRSHCGTLPSSLFSAVKVALPQADSRSSPGPH